MKTLFESIRDAGIPYGSHKTDLYFPDTPESRKILDEFPLEREIATIFQNQLDNKPWFDVPFAYLPAWERKTS